VSVPRAICDWIPRSIAASTEQRDFARIRSPWIMHAISGTAQMLDQVRTKAERQKSNCRFPQNKVLQKDRFCRTGFTRSRAGNPWSVAACRNQCGGRFHDSASRRATKTECIEAGQPDSRGSVGIWRADRILAAVHQRHPFSHIGSRLRWSVPEARNHPRKELHHGTAFTAF